MGKLLAVAALRVTERQAERIDERWEVCQACGDRDLVDDQPAGLCIRVPAGSACQRRRAWIGRILDGACEQFA